MLIITCGDSYTEGEGLENQKSSVSLFSIKTIKCRPKESISKWCIGIPYYSTS